MKTSINYKFIKHLALLLLIIAISYSLWTWMIHESWHAVACKILGGDPNLVKGVPFAQVGCYSDLGQIKNFIVLSIPYIFGMIVLLSFQFAKIKKYYTAAIPTAALIDSAGNLLTSISYQTNDLIQIGILGRIYLYITLLIIFINCMLYIRIFLKNNFCRYFY